MVQLRTANHIAMATIVVAVVVLGLKYIAFLVTGSVALYSDALESIINVVAAVFALVALRVAARPAARSASSSPTCR